MQATGSDSLRSITSALILAVSVCYHSRLQDRIEYEKHISSHFVSPLDLPGKEAQFVEEICWLVNVSFIYFWKCHSIKIRTPRLLDLFNTLIRKMLQVKKKKKRKQREGAGDKDNITRAFNYIACMQTYALALICYIQQVSECIAGQHGTWSKHCQECSPKRECLHDGHLHWAENPSLPRWQARKLQVIGQIYHTGFHAWEGIS